MRFQTDFRTSTIIASISSESVSFPLLFLSSTPAHRSIKNPEAGVNCHAHDTVKITRILHLLPEGLNSVAMARFQILLTGLFINYLFLKR